MKIWKELENHKGYWVSNFGEFISYRKRGPGNYLHDKPIFIKPMTITTHCGKKYNRVRIKKRDYYLHRLIAETFIENPLNKPQVNHIDNNGLNNNLSNLEWVTNSENQIHRFKSKL